MPLHKMTAATALLLMALVLNSLIGCGSSGTAAAGNGNPPPSTPPPTTPPPTTTVHDLSYVTNQLSSNISGYSFDGSNTAATPGSPYIADFGPGPILANASGTLIFAVMEQQAPTERGSNCFNAPAEVISYSVDQTSGALTLVQRLTMQKFCEYGAAIQGNSLYLIGKDQSPENWLEVVTFDSSGHMTEAANAFDLGNGGFDLFRLEVAPGGNFIFVTNRNAAMNAGVPGLLVYQRQPDGSWQTSSTITVPAQWGIALTPDGRTMMTTSMSDNSISSYAVDPSTGIVTPHGPLGSVDHPSRLAASPAGRFFAVSAANGIWMYAVDASGNVSAVPGSPFAAKSVTYFSVGFDTHGQYLTGVTDSAWIFRVDQTTGALTQVAGPLQVGQYPADVLMLTK